MDSRLPLSEVNNLFHYLVDKDRELVAMAPINEMFCLSSVHRLISTCDSVNNREFVDGFGAVLSLQL